MLERVSSLGQVQCSESVEDHITEGNSSGISWGLDLIVYDLASNLNQIFVGEDRANFAFEMREKLFRGRIVFQMALDSVTNHGVLVQGKDSLLPKKKPKQSHQHSPYKKDSDNET